MSNFPGDMDPTTSETFTTDMFTVVEDIQDEDSFLDVLGKVYYPCVIATGIIGNVLNLAVMSRPYLRKHASNIYLFGLALADLLVLVFQVTFKYAVFKAYHVTDPRDFFKFLCVYNNGILIGAVRTSFWITVGLSVDRYVAVAHPLIARTWSTPWRAKISVIVIFIAGFSYGAHAHFLREVNSDDKCVYSASGEKWRRYFSKLNASAYMVTYLLLGIFNGLIVYNVCIRSRRRGKIAPIVTTSSTSGTIKNNSILDNRRKGREQRLTLTLLLVSLLFMILWAPYLITYMTAQLPNNVGGLSKRDNLALCAEFMCVLNSTVNFFLYSVTNKRFRTQLVRLFWRKEHRTHARSPKMQTNVPGLHTGTKDGLTLSVLK